MPLPPLEVVWDLVKSILLPGFVVSLVVGLILLRWKGAGLALLLGLLAANVSNTPLPWFDWNQELGRVCFILVLSLATILLDGEHVWKWVAKTAWVGVLSGTLCFHDNIELSHRLAVTAASMAIYGVLILGERKLPGWILLGLLCATGLATALVMLHAHTARLSDVALMWMISSAGLFTATLLKKGETQGIAGPAAVLFPYLLYYGQLSTFSEVPVWSFLLIAAAPVACLLCLVLQPKFRVWSVSAVWLLFLIAAIGLAMRYESISAG
ncbi:MAG TPA: hypothetical protein PLN21_05285 [Gemmatales bacterium]|nr:hypothetical protein [Gemmatales bacterium]